MTQQYHVERADPTEVMPNLLRVWRENLSIEGEAEEKFDWVYRRCPDAPASVMMLRASEPESSQYVGTAGITRRRFWASGRELSAALMGDLAVDRRHRTLAPALSLVREARREALEHNDFAYGFPNRFARGVFRRAGYKELGPVTRYACVLRHTRYLERTLTLPVVARLAGPLVDSAMLARRMPRTALAAARYTLAFSDAPDERIDALWAEARVDYPLVAQRSEQFLRWRFFARREHQTRLAVLSRRSLPRRAAGYAIVQSDGQTAHVRDFFARQAELGTLFDLLLPALHTQGTESVSLAFLGSAKVVRVLLGRGFVPREGARAVYFDCASRERADLLKEVDRWYVTDGDEDT
jgi:hypothetical protein